MSCCQFTPRIAQTLSVFEELYFLVTGLPPNTHIVASRCADKGTYLHIKTRMLSELLTALVS